MLVIGYSDALQTWLCKNSWGTAWGMSGSAGWPMEFWDRSLCKGWVRNVNPDPGPTPAPTTATWYESGNGAMNRNLEVMGAGRDDSAPLAWVATGPGAWGKLRTDAAVCPTFTGTTFSRNMGWWPFDDSQSAPSLVGPRRSTGPWNDGGSSVRRTAVAFPVLSRGDYGAPGTSKVVVLVGGGQLQHVWRWSRLAQRREVRNRPRLLRSHLWYRGAWDAAWQLGASQSRSNGTMHTLAPRSRFDLEHRHCLRRRVATSPVMIQGQWHAQ